MESRGHMPEPKCAEPREDSEIARAYGPVCPKREKPLTAFLTAFMTPLQHVATTFMIQPTQCLDFSLQDSLPVVKDVLFLAYDELGCRRWPHRGQAQDNIAMSSPMIRVSRSGATSHSSGVTARHCSAAHYYRNGAHRF
jgi:hypothetical protein